MLTIAGMVPAPQLLCIMLTAYLAATLVVAAMPVVEWRKERRVLAPALCGSPAGGPADFSPLELQRLRCVAWRYRGGDLTEWPADRAGCR